MHSASLKAFGALAVTMFVASPALAQRMERGSFLRKPAESRAQLIAQVHRDPIVAARYRRHFRMTDQQLTRYFGRLTVSTLPRTGRYRVWHVEPDGRQESKVLLLKKGMGVFKDDQGRIILKKNCGNPMVTGDVAQRDITETKPPVAPREEIAMIQPTPPEVVPTQPDIAEVIPPVEDIIPPPIVDVAPPVILPPTVVEPAPIIPIAVGGGGGSFLPFLAIPVVGGLLLGGGGGGGDNPPPVPEPASIVALTAGVGLVMARRRKKKD